MGAVIFLFGPKDPCTLPTSLRISYNYQSPSSREQLELHAWLLLPGLGLLQPHHRRTERRPLSMVPSLDRQQGVKDQWLS